MGPSYRVNEGKGVRTRGGETGGEKRVTQDSIKRENA